LGGGRVFVLRGDVGTGGAGAFRVGLNEGQIGRPVPVLAMELARDRIVPAELGRATLQATIYSPDDAAKVGYLDEVVAPAELLARAKSEAARLGAFARFPFSATKSRMRGRTIDYIRSTLDSDLKTILSGN